MIEVTLKAAKASFFDRPKVQAAMDKAKRSVLLRSGSLVRTIARRSMRRRKRASLPGEPPSAHVGLIRDLLFFFYDESTKSVVAGPVLINKPTGAPKTLEHGGTATIEEHQFRFRNGRTVYETKTRKVRIAARPYMQPALRESLNRLPPMWANSIR